MKNFVAQMTFVDESADMFYEEGGVYDHHFRSKFGKASRPLTATELTATCPRCGQHFAATESCSAESNRDLHFDGDEDCPSICLNFPARPKGLLAIVPREGA
jgi:hypothetical protein